MCGDKNSIASLVMASIEKYADIRGVALPEDFSVLLERPKRADQGDWASNAAMKLSRLFSMPPLELAAEIASLTEKRGVIEKIEVAPPGFMNFTLTNDWISGTIKRVLADGRMYGSNNSGAGRKAQVEFVSANPTGPLHLGHGRGGAVGDVMASVLAFSGWEVEREYYINDAGLQMDNLGKSTQSRYFTILGRGDDAPFPEDGYPGDYIDDIARGIIDEHGDSFLGRPLDETMPFFRDRTCEQVLSVIQRDLASFWAKSGAWIGR